MKRTLPFAVLAVAVAVPSLSAQSLSDSRLKIETWASGLSSPTTFTWIGPGEMLVIQKNDGKVKWILDGVIKGTALDLNVQNDSERGGLGIAADPDFANNHWVYIYYSTTTVKGDSSTANKWADNRIDRFDWNGSTLVNQFGPIVAFPTDSAQANGSNHDGGVIRFGPDGMLYGQTGDLNRGRMGGGMERVEQNTAMSGSAHVGGFFRIAPDGSIPTDNPFVGESDSSFHLWWSYGLRNGFGFTWDAITGTLWDTENGPDKYDEVNRVPWGVNSGWLKIMGPDSRDAKYGENGNKSFDASDLTYLTNSTYLDPELSFLTPIGITAISFIHSKRFPADLRENCIFGDNNNGSLYYVPMRPARTGFKLPSGLGDKVVDNSTERAKIVWGNAWSVPTDIQVGSDHYLYVASLGLGKILRIRPLVDTIEPSHLLFPPSTIFFGSQENVEASDDLYYNAQEKGRLQRKMPPFKILAQFVLNSATPTNLTVDLEDHFFRDGYVQDIYVHSHKTKHFEKVDTAIIGKSDTLRSIALQNPSDYVDPKTFAVEVRIDVTWGTNQILGPLPPRKPVNVFIDLFQMTATYP